jgi:hypothetical protein
MEYGGKIKPLEQWIYCTFQLAKNVWSVIVFKNLPTLHPLTMYSMYLVHLETVQKRYHVARAVLPSRLYFTRLASME